MAATQQQRRIFSYADFLRLTTKRESMLVTQQTWVDGANVSVNLPQTGLLQKLWLDVDLQVIVLGTISAGVWATGSTRAPYSVVPVIQFGTNNNLQFTVSDGTSLAMWAPVHQGRKNNRATADFMCAANSAVLNMDGTSATPTPGAAVTPGTYRLTFRVPLYRVYSELGGIGMLVLQQQGVYHSVTLRLGQLSNIAAAPTLVSNDLFTGVTATGFSATVSGSFSIWYDWFDYVNDPGMLGDGTPQDPGLLGYFIRTATTPNNPLVNGQNTIQLPPQPFYTGVQVSAYNAGVPVPASQLGIQTFQHSNAVIISALDYKAFLHSMFLEDDQVAPDGTFRYDFGALGKQPHEPTGYMLFLAGGTQNPQILMNTALGGAPSGSAGYNYTCESLNAYNQIG